VWGLVFLSVKDGMGASTEWTGAGGMTRERMDGIAVGGLGRLLLIRVIQHTHPRQPEQACKARKHEKARALGPGSLGCKRARAWDDDPRKKKAPVENKRLWKKRTE
jgi:hypothetical protein